MREKSQVEDIDRSIYDIRDEEKDAYRMKEGLTPQIVEQTFQRKGTIRHGCSSSAWSPYRFTMRCRFRTWDRQLRDWTWITLPPMSVHIPKCRHPGRMCRKTSKRHLSVWEIPQAERKSLAGVGAQYDSELVYHNVKDEVAAQGVVYTDMESALKGDNADMVHKYFMKLVTPHDH